MQTMTTRWTKDNLTTFCVSEQTISLGNHIGHRPPDIFPQKINPGLLPHGSSPNNINTRTVITQVKVVLCWYSGLNDFL